MADDCVVVGSPNATTRHKWSESCEVCRYRNWPELVLTRERVPLISDERLHRRAAGGIGRAHFTETITEHSTHENGQFACRIVQFA